MISEEGSIIMNKDISIILSYAAEILNINKQQLFLKTSILDENISIVVCWYGQQDGKNMLLEFKHMRIAGDDYNIMLKGLKENLYEVLSELNKAKNMLADAKVKVIKAQQYEAEQNKVLDMIERKFVESKEAKKHKRKESFILG